jgi:two-component system, OmpR family, phosphate regulon sensor histidine kinase PhoR
MTDARKNTGLINAALEAMDELVLITDDELRLVYLSPGIKKTVNLPDKVLMTKSLEALQTQGWCFEALNRLVVKHTTGQKNKTQEVVECEIPQKGPGTYRVKIKTVKNTADNKNYLCIILTDISDRMRVLQDKDEFISIASHELKTPVTSIKAYAQLLQRKLVKEGSEQNATYVKKIEDQADKITGLINDLLDTSKMDSGKLKFFPEVLDLNKLAAETVANLQYSTESHHLVYNQSPSAVIVEADQERIEQVIENLVNNAVKYSPDDDRIEISLKANETEAELSIKDYGIGIKNKDLQKLFKPFSRIGEGPRQEGTGLGLYICYQIITEHQGEIGFKPNKPRGSIFYFKLPVLKQ